MPQCSPATWNAFPALGLAEILALYVKEGKRNALVPKVRSLIKRLESGTISQAFEPSALAA